MDKRLSSSAGLLALVALVLHAFTSPGERSTLPPGSAKGNAPAGLSAAQKAVDEAFEKQGPWRATQQYFHSEPALKSAEGCKPYLLPTPDDGSRSHCSQLELRSLYGFDRSGAEGKLTTLIATVPDPLHTRNSVETDRNLDAVQQAAFRSGWELATQWLPWTVKAAAENGAKEGSTTKAPDVEDLPGLLVFRHHFNERYDRAALLLVFVVGETPTAGLNGFQFEVARRSICTLTGFPTADIAIVGPTFSGSFPSLTRLLAEDPHPHHYEIRAGSVSNAGYAANMFHELENLREAPFLVDDCGPARRSVTFHGSTLPSRAFRARFGDLIKSWNYSNAEAAELIEDESGFSFQDPAQHKVNDDVITYRYPRDIAQLRNAYSDIAFAKPNKQDNTAAPVVEFSLKDTQSGEDIFPIFSSNHTPVSQNAALEQIVRNLNRQSIRVVSLNASNIFDTLFLASVLNRFCPDTRIVLNGSDLLFVQEAAQGSLTGLMAISPYPTFPEGAAWDHAKQHDITTFADADSVGEFNATLVLLHGDPTEAEPYASAAAGSQISDFSDWLLVLGRTGWLPVDRLGQDTVSLGTTAGRRWFDLSHAGSTEFTGAKISRTSMAWALVCLLVAGASVGFCGRMQMLRYQPRRLVWSALCLSDLDGPGKRRPVSETVQARYVCLLSCLGSMVFAAGLLLSPMMAATRVHDAPMRDRWLVPMMVVALMLPFLSMLQVAVEVPLVVAGKSARWATVTAPLRVLLIALPAAGIGFWWGLCSAGERGYYFCFRCFALAAPICPLWPPLLAAGAWFALSFFHLRRFTWASRQRPELDTAIFDESLCGQFQTLKERLNAALLNPGSGVAVALVLMLAAVLAVPFLVQFEFLRSFESPHFETLIACILLPVALFTALSFYEFASCWRILRAFLVTLNSVVIGRFFSRLPDFTGSGPVWIREVQLGSLSSSINSAIALHNLDLKHAPAADGFAKYRAAMQAFLAPASEERGRYEFIQSYAKFRTAAAEISQQLGTHVLRPYWTENTLPFVEWKEGEETEMAAAVAAVGAGAGSGRTHARHRPGSGISEEMYKFAAKYVALQYAAFLGYALRHLRNLLLCCMTCFVLLVVTLNSFSFQAPHAILQALVVGLVLGAAVVLPVLAQLERDPVLSRLSGTTEGELGKDFYLRVLTYGALPVLSVLSTQFPSMARFLSTWAEPTLNAMH